MVKGDDFMEIWNKVKSNIGEEGKEIKTFTITNRKRKYFFAKVVNDSLIISRSLGNEESCSINIPRTITYKQFKEVYDLYDLYIKKEKGIRERMTKLNNNTTYIISIIKSVEE
ncbi:hypothetical protein QTI80_11450 [Clostridium perfringens]|nr:hypothetical protein [Clostridium perfringens]